MNEITVEKPFRTGDIISDDAEQLAQQLALDAAERLKTAIDTRDEATLVVSGGSTPLPFFKALSEHSLPWEKVTVLLADERWVEPDDKDSNERFVKTYLLTGLAAKAKFTGLKNAAATPQAGWQDCEAMIASVARPFDVVVLGMGGDGHTASLFPETDGLVDALAKNSGKLTWPMNPPNVPQARMSLTLDALLDSRSLVLHITGDNKKSIFQLAQSVDAKVYPIAAVINNAQEKLQVYWAP